MNTTLCLTTLRKYKRENSYKRLKKKPVEAPESPTEYANKEEWVELSLDALKEITGQIQSHRRTHRSKNTTEEATRNTRQI